MLVRVILPHAHVTVENVFWYETAIVRRIDIILFTEVIFISFKYEFKKSPYIYICIGMLYLEIKRPWYHFVFSVVTGGINSLALGDVEVILQIDILCTHVKSVLYKMNMIIGIICWEVDGQFCVWSLIENINVCYHLKKCILWKVLLPILSFHYNMQINDKLGISFVWFTNLYISFPD